MELLEAVNRSLRFSSHPPVNDLDVGDQRAALAQETIKSVRKRILGKGWPFNTTTVEFAVNTAGRVPVARSLLKVRFSRNDRLTVRPDGGSLYVWNNEDNDWHGLAVRDVDTVFDYEEFADIPNPIAQWIAWEAAAEFYEEMKGSAASHLWERKNRAQATAVNSIPGQSIHEATGHPVDHNRMSGAPWIWVA